LERDREYISISCLCVGLHFDDVSRGNIPFTFFVILNIVAPKKLTISYRLEKTGNMKILIGMLTCSYLLLCVCCLLHADEISDKNEVNTAATYSAQAQPSNTGLHAVLGAGVYVEQNMVGHNDVTVLPLPLIYFTYSDWADWSFGRGGVWLLQSSDHSLKLGVGMKLHFGWSPGDDSTLSGMSARSYSIDGAVNALWTTPLITVGASYYHDILNVSNGSSAVLRLSKTFWVTPGFRLTPIAGVEWQGAKLVNYYFGVQSQEVTASRPAYVGRDTINVGAGLEWSYRISKDWSFLGSIYTMRFGSGITNSPIVLRDFWTYTFFGIGWTF
jgi:MipA family protein